MSQPEVVMQFNEGREFFQVEVGLPVTDEPTEQTVRRIKITGDTETIADIGLKMMQAALLARKNGSTKMPILLTPLNHLRVDAYHVEDV